MQSLSQKEYSNLKELYESIYAPKEELTEEILEEVFNELVDELIEEGCAEEEAIDIIESATDEYIEEAKVTFGHDTTPTRASGAPIGARRRQAKRKAGEALKGAMDTVKSKAAGAVAGAQIAGAIAKDEARRAGRKAAHSVSKAADAVKSAPGKAKEKAKSGIKGFIKRQAQKVVKRMSEEIEALKATGKFSEKEIEAFMESDLDQMQKDADANRARAAKLKDGNVTKGSASFAAAKVADDVKKAARTGPQQHRGTRTGGYRIN